MNVVGLDLSLRSPGVADESGARTIKVPTKFKGMERLEWIRNAMRSITTGADLVVIEGYSMGSHSSSVTGLAELGGVVRLSLYRCGTPYVDIAPNRLKKFATGKGNANKDVMLVQAVRRSGIEMDGNDAADAWWLRQCALVRFGLPGAVKLPAAQAEVVRQIDWPEIKVAVSA